LEGLPSGKDYYQTKTIKGWVGDDLVEVGKATQYTTLYPPGTIVA
jgi:hypothetical protein